jgi:hypothetical protein
MNENPRKLECLCSKNAPFGNNLIDLIKSIPTLDFKFDILKQIKNSIDRIEISRGQMPLNTSFGSSVPKLPEPLTLAPTPSKVVVSTITTYSTPVSLGMPEWLSNMGEDGSVAIMREEARREDARQRREAMEEEMMMKEKALAYRKQLEREAEDRRRANDEYRRDQEKLKISWETE